MTAEQNPVYIVAVSGGLDSVSLLHMLLNNKIATFPPANVARYVVAHVNHGIRPESPRDQEFVRKLAEHYHLPFETTTLELGPGASEDEARRARYEFLESVANKYHTTHIVLAHHADDVVETAIINISRGTGRTGLSSLRSKKLRTRPLLHIKKVELRDYAVAHKLEWVEDSTNQENTYLRNHVRNNVLSRAGEEWHTEFATVLQKSQKINDLLDQNIATVLQYRFNKRAVIKRSWFVLLDHAVACEIMRAVLMKLDVSNMSRELIERLVLALKVGRPGSTVDVDGAVVATITKRSLRFVDRDTKKTLSV